jgi:peptide deformylase
MHLVEYTRRLLARHAPDTRSGVPDEAVSLPIVQAGHPALRRPAHDAHDRLPSDLLGALLRSMAVTMRKAPGVGLAAPQVAVPLRMFVAEDRVPAPAEGEPADPEDDLLERRPLPLRAFLDPSYEILDEERVHAFEGCLSVDGWSSIVPRARRIRFRATEVLGDGTLRDVDEQHRGWTARILQHETDHLAGALCHDRAVPRSFVLSRYTARYDDLTDAVRELGLTGDVTRLGHGEVVLPAPTTDR